MNSWRIGALAVMSAVSLSCASTKIENINQASSFEKSQDEKDIWKQVEEVEEAIGHSGFIYDDPALTAYINSVLDNLVGEEEKKAGVDLKVQVIKDPMFNAFAFPTGGIYIHTAVLANLENEAQLATILGHEATHFFHRHTLRQMRSVVNKSAFYGFFSISTAGVGDLIGQLAGALVGLGIQGSVYGYSRELEREADEHGFQFLVRAGYDPSQSKVAFEKILEDVKEDKKHPYFYNTHPRVQERITSFEKMTAELQKEQGGELTGATNEDKYREMTKGLLLDNAEMTLMRNRPDMAQKQIERYLAIAPEDPRAYCLLGESHLKTVEKLQADKKKMKDPKTPAEIEASRKKAVEFFDKSLAINPDYPHAHRQLGLYYYKNNEKEKAKPYLSRYLELEPDGDRAEYIRGYLNET